MDFEIFCCVVGGFSSCLLTWMFTATYFEVKYRNQERVWWANGVRYGRSGKSSLTGDKPKENMQRFPCTWSPNRNWDRISGAATVQEAIEIWRSQGMRIDSVTEYPKAGVTFCSVLDPKTGSMERAALRTFEGVFTFSFTSPFVEKYEAILQQGEQR